MRELLDCVAMDNKEIPPTVREWYSDIGKRGVAGRLRNLDAKARAKVARAGGLARQEQRRRDEAAARLSGSKDAGK